MQYHVTINNKTYEVEIEDINARPVVARVQGQRFEILPEAGNKPNLHKEADEVKAPAAPILFTNPIINSNEIIAPLPGTVVEVFVKTGDSIEKGQVVLVIEAMKMKNSIRATRSGKIKEVLVSTGVSVRHKQALIQFAAAGEAAWI